MSADDNAPEQAREVEVVARAILDASGFPNSPITPADLSIGMAAHRALAPIREAERQEAAREAAERAWDEGVRHAESREGGMTCDPRTANPYRADGVTGQTDDDTDHEQKDHNPQEHR